jgi:nicotinate-nucleotide--dimethylbenzimidazole phosphoribosyltransferase
MRLNPLSITIPLLDADMMQQADMRQRQLTKPGGALGRLENLSVRLVGMTGRMDWLPSRRRVIVCAADHGIVAQGISAYPQAVTYQMVLNFLHGGAAINVLARQMNAQVTIVDAGVIGDFEAHLSLVQGKVAHGTRDFSQEHAMSETQAQDCIALGRDVAQQAIATGVDIIAVGEMGIGNTTSASAIISAITHTPPHAVTGRGTGIDDATLAHKVSMIERALARHAPTEQNTLAKIGGFEIGALAGVMLACAEQRVPIVLDGLISTSAALIATQYAPQVRDYLIAGHRSVEQGHQIALAYLGLEPLLDLGLRLGEGTGAVLALPAIEASMRTLQEMATFSSANVSDKDVE